MILSKEEFAKIWKKETADLSQLDFFTFLLINDLETLLINYFTNSKDSEDFKLTKSHVSELVVQLADGLQFFFEQICFGKGCALGCPNKLDTPFSDMEENTRLEIIESEFNGNAAACRTRRDCFKHDLINYIIKDTILDYYTHFLKADYSEDDPQIINMTNFVADNIVKFTMDKGPHLLKEPYRKAAQFTD